MRVLISTVSSDDDTKPPWSMELDLASDMRVSELKELLSDQHGLGLQRGTKVLSRQGAGVMFTLEDSAKVTKDMLLRGVTVPPQPITPVQKFLAREKGIPMAPTRPPPGSRAAPSQSAHGAAPLKPHAGYPLTTPPASKAAPTSQRTTTLGRSWLRMMQRVWPQLSWVKSLARGPGRPEVSVMDFTKVMTVLGDITIAFSEPKVQNHLDSIFAACGSSQQQLEPAAEGGEAKVIRMVMDVSRVMCKAARPVLSRKGYRDGELTEFAAFFEAVDDYVDEESMSTLLGSFHFMLWMGGQDPRVQIDDRMHVRKPRRQPVKAMPSSIFLAYAFHAALAPLERRKRATFRAVAFVEMMLREYAKSVAEGWSDRGNVRRPLTVWLLGAKEAEEGRLARCGYFEDAAGLLGGEGEQVTLYLIGEDLSAAQLPSGKRVRLQVAASPLDAPRPDLVVCPHAALSDTAAGPLSEWLPVLAALLGAKGKEPSERLPVVAVTARCQAEAKAASTLFVRLGSKVLLDSVRNLFSSMAAGPHVKYDDHGWVTAVQGSSYGAEELAQLDTGAFCSAVPELQAELRERTDRSPAVFWGILDLKYDPRLELEQRVKVLETGDGRSSRFSGYGAAIKENFKADKKLEETLHRSVLVENKKLTRDFFVDGGYAHLMPNQLCLSRVYSESLAEDISRELHLEACDCCVLKLCNRARGAGCIPIEASSLDQALERLLVLPEDPEAWLQEQNESFPRDCSWGCFEEQVRHWWSNECPVFLAEELCHSLPVQQDGRSYDATMRVGFSLHRVEAPSKEDAKEEADDETRLEQDHAFADPHQGLAEVQWPGEANVGSLSLEWLGGYWKLPGEDMSSSNLTGKIISKARQGTAPVESKELHEVYAAMGDAVEKVFTNRNLSPQTLLRRYPDNRELGAFLAARLACSMRMRDVTKSNTVLSLAQTANAKCCSLPSKFVDSYIHRNFGVMEALMGRWPKAAEHFRRSLTAMPSNATSRYLLGMQCLDAEQWTVAIDHLKASLQFDPDFKAPWVNLGFAYLRLREWDAAIEASAAGLYRHPYTPQCFYNKGLASYFKALDAESQALPGQPSKLRADALQSFDDARANLERSSLWTDKDDQLVEALKNADNPLSKPLCWDGWKFFGWRP